MLLGSNKQKTKQMLLKRGGGVQPPQPLPWDPPLVGTMAAAFYNQTNVNGASERNVVLAMVQSKNEGQSPQDIILGSITSRCPRESGRNRA